MHSHRGEDLPPPDSSSRKVDTWLPPKHPNSRGRSSAIADNSDRYAAHDGSYKKKKGIKLPMSFPQHHSQSGEDESDAAESSNSGGFFENLFGGGVKSKSAAPPSSRVRCAGDGKMYKSRSLSPNSRAKIGRIGSLGKRLTSIRKKNSAHDYEEDDVVDPAMTSIGPPKGAALYNNSREMDNDDEMTERALLYEARKQREEELQKQQQPKKDTKDTIGVDRPSSNSNNNTNSGTGSVVPGTIVAMASRDDSSIDSTDRALMFEMYQERMETEQQCSKTQATKAKTVEDIDTSDVDSHQALLFDLKQEQLRELCEGKGTKFDTPVPTVVSDPDTSDVDSYQALLFEMKQERIRELRQLRDEAEAKLRAQQNHKAQAEPTSSSWSLWWVTCGD